MSHSCLAPEIIGTIFSTSTHKDAKPDYEFNSGIVVVEEREVPFMLYIMR